MPLDVQAFATEVAHTITLAITPLLERLTAIETRLAYVGDLRDRVVTLEAKAAIPPVVQTIDDPTPLLAELRDRVVSLEAQTAALPRLDLTPAMERVAALEARVNILGDLRDRVVTMETKAAAPVVLPEPPEIVLPDIPDVGPIIDKVDRLWSFVENRTSAMGERLAALEVKPLLPGPAGKDGRDGKDGVDGKDGINGEPGLGFDDLRVEQDGERGVVVKFARGMELKEFPLMFPIVVYRGVFTDGKGYSVGDVVTWAGSAWHCQQDTTDKPEENHRAWRLMVKRGNEGRAGRDGKDLLPPPVVSTGVARAR